MRGSTVLLLAALYSAGAGAAEVEIGTGTSTVRSAYLYGSAYPEIAGDMIVDISDPLNASVCRGGWIRRSDAHYQQFVQLLTTAKVSRSLVRVLGDDSQLFPGSSDRFCHLNIVALL
jgi:hypothetical protein